MNVTPLPGPVMPGGIVPPWMDPNRPWKPGDGPVVAPDVPRVWDDRKNVRGCPNEVHPD